ncbi:hypothetical protein ILUMI_00739, partial [Ignelater luminosus]
TWRRNRYSIIGTRRMDRSDSVIFQSMGQDSNVAPLSARLQRTIKSPRNSRLCCCSSCRKYLHTHLWRSYVFA